MLRVSTKNIIPFHKIPGMQFTQPSFNASDGGDVSFPGSWGLCRRVWVHLHLRSEVRRIILPIRLKMYQEMRGTSWYDWDVKMASQNVFQPVPLQRILKGLDMRKKREDNIIAEGEATGHAHRLNGKDAAVFDTGQGVDIECPNGGVVVHEEHHTIAMPPGKYMTGTVREVDHVTDEVRAVAD